MEAYVEILANRAVFATTVMVHFHSYIAKRICRYDKNNDGAHNSHHLFEI